MIDWLFDRSILMPTFAVPSGKERFLKRTKFYLLGKLAKFWKRKLYKSLFLDLRYGVLEQDLIPADAQQILWINLSAPSLGDSLMDLSARSLLGGRSVTLVTSEKNQCLYSEDAYFAEVFGVEYLRERSPAGPYDFVLCDSFSPRVLKVKAKLAPYVPFAGLYGFLNGFEVHRTYFAFARMMELLALDRMNEPMRPTITLPLDGKDKSPEFDVCIAIGGEWSFRTYDHWSSVVSWLIAQGYSVSLVGSDNGVSSASEILELEPTVRSTVGALSLPEVVAEIAKADVFVGADGGLWHIACAIPIPSVVLFADCQIFDDEGNRVTRETKDMICETLYDDIQVSNIPSDSVIEAFKRLSARVGLHAS